MADNASTFHFSSDIKLSQPPLAEAWLEIRWKLEPIDPPQVMKDPGFLFALGPFSASIQERFPFREDLPAAEAPDQMLPHVVRYRFRVGEEDWPLLQIGPGVATVNFVGCYTWEDFVDQVSYLRTKLLDAYGESSLEGQAIILRYRNLEPFDYDSNDILDFMQGYLNTAIRLPSYIPGHVSRGDMPSLVDMKIEFNLRKPRGVGRLQFATAIRQVKDRLTNEASQVKCILWDLSVTSKGEDTPQLYDESGFQQWLDSAHAVIHDWFFSLIEGDLRQKYS